MRAAFLARSRQRAENAGKGIREMFKRKTDGMPNLKGQEMNEVQMKKILNNDDYVAVSENIEAASENATKADVEYYINQHDTAADAHAEILKKKSEFVKVTIPRGRMRGDVNNDGIIDKRDAALINDYIAGRIEISGEENLKSLDADGNGRVNVSDAIRAEDVENGAVKYGAQPDILGSWSVDPSYEMEGEYYQFYTDIEIEGITRDNSAVVFISEYDVYDVIVKAECDDGILRVYTKRCPISESKCGVQIFEGDGSADVVYSGDPAWIKNIEMIIPKGRMLGDVNDDGKVDDIDAKLINDSIAGRIEITNSLALECRDADSNGSINSGDAVHAINVGRGNIKYGMQYDILENWTVNPNYETEDGQFYKDIDIRGIKEKDSVIVFVDDIRDYEILVKGEVISENKIRIYVSRCPVAEIKCSILSLNSQYDKNAIFKFVYTGKYKEVSNDFVVTVTKDENGYYNSDYSSNTIIKMAEQGMEPVLYYEGNKYILTGIFGTIVNFSRILTNTGARYSIMDQFCIQSSIVDYTGMKTLVFDDVFQEYIPKIKRDIRVPQEDWETADDYEGYSYKAVIPFSGADSNDSNITVVFTNTEDMTGGNYAPILTAENDNIYIYAKSVPNDILSIEAIVYQKCKVVRR